MTREAAGRSYAVQLFGQLVSDDVAWELWFALLRRSPLRALGYLLRSGGRRRVLTRLLEADVEIDPTTLPYRSAALNAIESVRRDENTIYLVCDRASPLGPPIAAHLGLALAPDGTDARPLPDGAPTVAPMRPAWRRWARQLRLHQWIKNLLIFVPLVASHRLGETDLIVATVTAFIAFGCIASATYVFNDLLDVHADRRHASKRYRPLAAGTLAISTVSLVAAVLLVIGLALSVTLPLAFVEAIAIYLVGTLSYSLVLKKLAPLDTLVLAGLYALRVLAGNAATGIPTSFWLLLFSIFFFLSLAMAKRHAELTLTAATAKDETFGRGYLAADREMVSQLGVGAGYVAVLVLALYLNSPEAQALYSRPRVIWLVCVLLLYWMSRLWFLSHRGQLHEDPVVFAIRDRTSLVVLGLALGILVVAK